MLDFWAKGADGVTVRRVTLFVVVLRMAGGLPSLALVATGEELRNVFMVAVVDERRRGFPLCTRGCRRVSLAWRFALRRGFPLGEGAAGLRSGIQRFPRGIRRWRALRGHQGPRAGLLRAYESRKGRLDAQQLVPAAEPRWFTERAPGPPSTFRAPVASLAPV